MKDGFDLRSTQRRKTTRTKSHSPPPLLVQRMKGSCHHPRLVFVRSQAKISRGDALILEQAGRDFFVRPWLDTQGGLGARVAGNYGERSVDSMSAYANLFSGFYSS